MNNYTGTMKRIIFCGGLALMAGISGVMAQEQQNGKIDAIEVESKVSQIRKWYSEIESDKTLKKTSFNDGDKDGPDRLEITRYTTADGELKKLHRYAGGDHGVGNETYYFHNGKLFFVYIASNYWRFAGSEGPNGESETLDIASQQRLYFHNDQCIKALEKRLEVKGADGAPLLLDKVPNKMKEIDDRMQSYVARAKRFAEIRSQGDFEKFLSQP
ncbi:hypothetical protein NT6N_11070 [Oceaniferula spumae]|uniref:Uncharacterized protein n=1 Tax=Oceaniferula spumae TaxID=2979115 RepID=A0AAT9FJF9_9BACT